MNHRICVFRCFSLSLTLENGSSHGLIVLLFTMHDAIFGHDAGADDGVVTQCSHFDPAQVFSSRVVDQYFDLHIRGALCCLVAWVSQQVLVLGSYLGSRMVLESSSQSPKHIPVRIALKEGKSVSYAAKQSRASWTPSARVPGNILVLPYGGLMSGTAPLVPS